MYKTCIPMAMPYFHVSSIHLYIYLHCGNENAFSKSPYTVCGACFVMHSLIPRFSYCVHVGLECDYTVIIQFVLYASLTARECTLFISLLYFTVAKH